MKEALLNNFAIRSFRDTADRDYVHARLAYRAHLVPQFQWSALHALEKYAKCILLLNRIPAKHFRHEVTGAIALMASTGPFEIPLSDQTRKFIERLENGAEFRYFEVSYFNLEYDLIRLDRAVWELRRYCQVLNHEVELSGRRSNALTMHLERLRRAMEKEEKGTCILNGWLESVIRKKTDAAREPLLWNNLYFGPSNRKTVRMRSFMEAGNAPLYMHPEIIDDVTRYVFLPKRVEKSWRKRLEEMGGRDGSGRNTKKR